jgi:hypothetical protein
MGLNAHLGGLRETHRRRCHLRGPGMGFASPAKSIRAFTPVFAGCAVNALMSSTHPAGPGEIDPARVGKRPSRSFLDQASALRDGSIETLEARSVSMYQEEA